MGELTTNPHSSVGHRTRLMRDLRTSPAAGTVEVARRMLAPIPKNARMAATIAGAVETLLSHYWQPNDDERIRTAALSGWLETLGAFPEWAIMEALSEWRDTKTTRPAPAHIRGICLEKTGELRDALAKATQKPVTNRRAPSAESRARVQAEVDKLTKIWRGA